jgi:hypothetical protein
MKIYNKYILNFNSAHTSVEFYMAKKKPFASYVKVPIISNTLPINRTVRARIKEKVTCTSSVL